MPIVLKGQRSRRVRWAQWADGQRWKLTPGVDHDQPARDALKAARVWALKHGFRAVAELPGPSKPFETPWVLTFVVRDDGDG